MNGTFSLDSVTTGLVHRLAGVHITTNLFFRHLIHGHIRFLIKAVFPGSPRFVNKNKGVRIPIYENGKVVKNELIKKEEIITKVEEISKENWTGKYDCTVVLEGNTLSFEFEEKAVQNFFDVNYTGEMVNKAIGYKNKFKFKSAYSDGLD